MMRRYAHFLFGSLVMTLVAGCSKPVGTSPVPPASKLEADPGKPEKTVPAETGSDHQRIQGRWDFVTLVNGPRDFIDFSQDKVSFHVRETIVAGTFVIDGTAQPKRRDLTFAGNTDGLGSPQGIFEFQQDLLVICLATTDGFWPTEFKGTEQQNLMLFSRPTPDPAGSSR